jgi:hypothetical protein
MHEEKNLEDFYVATLFLDNESSSINQIINYQYKIATISIT